MHHAVPASLRERLTHAGVRAACALVFLWAGTLAAFAAPAAASTPAASDTAAVQIAYASADDSPAAVAPSAGARAEITSALARAYRVRLVTADTAWTAMRATASDEGVRWTRSPRREGEPLRSGLVPWADLVALDVRGVDRVGPAITSGFLGLLGGAAGGALLGYAMVHGDTSDLSGMAPYLGAIGGGLVGGVGGVLWGAVDGAPAGEWERVFGPAGAGADASAAARTPRADSGREPR